jgi:cytochrome c oxidase subunit 2
MSGAEVRASSTAARCVVAAVLAAGAGYLAAAAQPPVSVDITARKFEFSVKEVHARKGEPLTVVVSASDFVHGFSMPDFNVRADVVPGKPAKITITPAKSGRYVFVCDNFCGEGHDRMSGVIVVED